MRPNIKTDQQGAHVSSHPGPFRGLSARSGWTLLAVGVVIAAANALWAAGQRADASGAPAAQADPEPQAQPKAPATDKPAQENKPAREHKPSDEPTDPRGPAAETQVISDFTLRNPLGKAFSLADYHDKPVVVVAFLGTQCPLAKLYAPRLVELASRYRARGVQFLGIVANAQDSLTELDAFRKRNQLNFPLLKDSGSRVADLFGAERTPEVFVLDHQRTICYRGRIDDQYGVGFVRQEATRHDLVDALESVLEGEVPARQYVPAPGCLIGRVRKPVANPTVTYCDQIVRILQKHCVSCHREGEIAPFALTDYQEVAGWAAMLAEVVADHRMPPWNANPKYGKFRNARGMSAEEQELLKRWVEQGAPEGDPAQLPPPPEFPTGWRLPKPPDLVLAMRDKPFQVPADETVEYQYFVVDPGFTEDKWVSAAELVPGNRSVVHHAIVFIRPPTEIRSEADLLRSGIGWLTAYVPGQATLALPPGLARRVPAGSKLVFQMHYTPTGTPQEDVTQLGLVFADPQTVREEVITLLGVNREFEIPPHAANYAVPVTVKRFPPGAKLFALAPHMHLRGKSFRFRAVPPSGESQVLLDVPQYDFNWQHVYVLEEPLPLEPGFRLECEARFDNSQANLVNPDPAAAVHWGDQTWEEMALAYIEITRPREVAREASPASGRSPAASVEVLRLADEFITRLDRNGDGVVRRGEVPKSFSIFGFHRYDYDRDGAITRAEAIRAAHSQAAPSPAAPSTAAR